MQIRVSYDLATLGAGQSPTRTPPEFGKKFRTDIKKLGTLNILFYIRFRVPLFPKMRGSGLGPIFLRRSTARMFCFC